MAQLRPRLHSPLLLTFNRVYHREAVPELVEKNRLHPTRLKISLRSALVYVAASASASATLCPTAYLCAAVAAEFMS